MIVRLTQLLAIIAVVGLAFGAQAQQGMGKGPAKEMKKPAPVKAAPTKGPPAKVGKDARVKPEKAEKDAKIKPDKVKGDKSMKKPEEEAPVAADMAVAPADPDDALPAPERHKKIKERAEKRRSERAKLRQEHRIEKRNQVKKVLKGKPMDQAMKQELKRHARRMARLDRVMEVAAEAGDDDTVQRAKKLRAKEIARHEQFMGNAAANPGKGGVK